MGCQIIPPKFKPILDQKFILIKGEKIMTEIFRADIANVLLKKGYHISRIRPDLAIKGRLCFVFEEDINEDYIKKIAHSISLLKSTRVERYD